MKKPIGEKTVVDVLTGKGRVSRKKLDPWSRLGGFIVQMRGLLRKGSGLPNSLLPWPF